MNVGNDKDYVLNCISFIGYPRTLNVLKIYR